MPHPPPETTLYIGLDAKRAFCTATGLGQYSRRLIEGFARVAPSLAQTTGIRFHFILYTPFRRLDWQPPPNTRTITMRPSWWRRPFHWWWRTWYVGKLASRQTNLFHGLSNELPLNLNCPSVVTIHDLLFREIPRNFPWIDRQIYAWKVRQALARATRIICITQHVRQQVLEWSHCSPERLSVIPPPLSPLCFQDADTLENNLPSWLNDKLRDAPRPWLLFFGRLEYRKNLHGIVQALAQFPHTWTLIVVGKPTRYGNRCYRVLQPHLRRGVREWRALDPLPAPRLLALIRQVDLVLFPSLAEGFGYPVAEALAMGTPVLAGDHPAMREAGGNAALYVPPQSPEAIRSAIDRLLHDQTLRAQLIVRGKTYVQRFHPEQVARQILHLYLDIL